MDKLIINVGSDVKISVKEIEDNIGISKDYNIWELQSALLVKNSAKAFTILHYLNKNTKTNPFVLTMTNLHATFMKLYQYLLGPDAKEWDLWKLYGIHSSQTADYKKAKTLYKPADVEKIFEVFLEYDLRIKGVHNVETPTEELLRELVYKVLN